MIAATPPRERTVVEGNLVEHPIWKLNNRQARPKRAAVDAATGELREYVDPEDYTQTFELGPDPADARARHQLVMRADVHAGFPTMHAFRVLLVVIERAHHLGYAGQRVPITPTEIAAGLGLVEPGGKDYRSIYASLDALENVQLCFVASFYDRTARMVHPGRLTERLVKKARFRLRARSTPPAAPAAAVGGEVEPEDFVELGDALWRSLTSGYRFAVDRAYLNALPTELAQRLYGYLAKKDRASRFYEERVVSLGRHLGLARTSPSHVRASLELACRALQAPIGAERKAFLRAFGFEGERGAMKLVIEANREHDSADPGAGRLVVDELSRRFARAASDAHR